MSLRALAALLFVLAPALAFAAPPAQQATPPSPPAAQVPATPQAGLPAQPQETHGDWRIFCSAPNNQKGCVFSQQLSDKASGKPVLGVELRATAADRLTATIITPFGVAVDKPVTIRVDEATPMTVPFKTCIPLGCVVTTTWESSMVAALRAGKAIYIRILAPGTGQAISFRISLNGFGSALDRSIVLSKP